MSLPGNQPLFYDTIGVRASYITIDLLLRHTNSDDRHVKYFYYTLCLYSHISYKPTLPPDKKPKTYPCYIRPYLPLLHTPVFTPTAYTCIFLPLLHTPLLTLFTSYLFEFIEDKFLLFVANR
jgi:hypothetical protein